MIVYLYHDSVKAKKVMETSSKTFSKMTETIKGIYIGLTMPITIC